jgi:hypothetical protein
VKLLAETTGPFGLLDLSTGQTLNANRPSVVSRSSFIDSRIALSQIVKVADVPDEVTDMDFENFWRDSDGDRDLAVASFLSQFDPEAPQAPAPKKRGK